MEVVKIGKEIEKDKIDRVVSASKEGKIAIFPTDTVYGIGALISKEESIKKLAKLKKRDSSKKFPILISKIEEGEGFACFSPLARKMAIKYWPGATTLILKSRKKLSPFLYDKEGRIALRVPDLPFIQRVIEESGEPLVGTSANLSEGVAPSGLDDIPEELKERVDVIIEGGKTKGRESDIWEVNAEVKRLVRGKVLFICTGNSCRSVAGEYFLKKFLKEKRIEGINVDSAGILNLEGMPPPLEIKIVLKEKGIDAESHRSKQVNKEMIEDASLIFVMEERHRESILNASPQSEDKIVLLDIPDPIGRSIDIYRLVLNKLEEAIIGVRSQHLTLNKL